MIFRTYVVLKWMNWNYLIEVIVLKQNNLDWLTGHTNFKLAFLQDWKTIVSVCWHLQRYDFAKILCKMSSLVCAKKSCGQERATSSLTICGLLKVGGFCRSLSILGIFSGDSPVKSINLYEKITSILFPDWQTRQIITQFWGWNRNVPPGDRY